MSQLNHRLFVLVISAGMSMIATGCISCTEVQPTPAKVVVEQAPAPVVVAPAPPVAGTSTTTTTVQPAN